MSAALIAVAYHPLFSGMGSLNDDYPAVYLRIQQYAQEFRLGHVPQLFPDVVRGGGYAFPRFYPPLTYYVGAAVYGLVGDIVWAGHLTALMSVLLSAATMSWAARRLGVPPRVAVVAGLAYATFPYRFTNVLVRGAVAESWALVWLPLVFASAVRLAQGLGSGPALAVAAGLLMVTHTGLALWALPLLLATALAATPAGRLARGSRTMIWSSMAGICLAAWYLFPMSYYLPGVRASDPEVMWATATQFARWHMDWGKTLGLARLENNLQTGLPLPFPMAVSIGLPALVMPFALILARRDDIHQPARPGYRLVLAAGISALAALLVMVYPRLVATRLPQALLYLQFPYRLAGVAGLFAILATALALARVDANQGGSLLFAVWVVLVAGTVVYEARQPTPTRPVSDGDLLLLLPSRDKGLTARYEYLPNTTRPEEIGLRVLAARRALKSIATAYSESTDRLQVTLHVPQPTQITFPRLAYDVFRVVDQAGRPLPTSPNGGLLAVTVSAGDYTLVVSRWTPWPTRLGILGTLLSVVVLASSARRRNAAGLITSLQSWREKRVMLR